MTVHSDPDLDSTPPARNGPPEPETATHAVADGIEHRLDPRSVTLHRITGAIVWAITAGGTLVGTVGAVLASPLGVWARGAVGLLGFALMGGLTWLTYRWPEIEHRHVSYRVDARGIEIRRGVFWRRLINVPRLRVQHTDVAQGPLERHFGLGTLIIFTAGTDHARVDLSGLDHRRALAIRNHLLPEEGSDAV